MHTLKQLLMVLLLLLTVTAATVFASGEIVVIGDDLSTAGATTSSTSWMKFIAAQEVNVVNATRPQWYSGEVWYVREVLEQYPHARAYIIFASTNDLRQINGINPEAIARVGARLGYMTDIIREKNPAANVLLVVPPRPVALAATENETLLILSELLAASVEKTARARKVHYLCLLETFATTSSAEGNEVYPSTPEAQNQLAKLIWEELRYPVVNRREPVAAQVSVLAPPAAGMPVIDGQSADHLALAIADDLQQLPTLKKSSSTLLSGAAWQNKTPMATEHFVSNRDLAEVVSEEALALGDGILDGIKTALVAEMNWQETLRMEEMFEQSGADVYAQVNTLYAPHENPAMISAIVPAAEHAAEIGGLLGAAVDWENLATSEVADNPAFNHVVVNQAAKAAKKPLVPPLMVDDFSDNPDEIFVPGLARFDQEPLGEELDATLSGNIYAHGVPPSYEIVEVIREEIPQPDLASAPWNRANAAEKITADEILTAGELLAAVAAATAKQPEVNEFKAPSAKEYPLPEIDEYGGVKVGAVNKLGNTRIEDLLRGKKIIHVDEVEVAATRYVNAETTMMPLRESAMNYTLGHSVYIHTAIE